MPRASHKCPKCPRSFNMPAHLARHLNAIHRSGSRKKTATTRSAKVGRPTSVGAGRPARKSVTRSPVGVLSSESTRFLGDMQSHHANLIAQRTSLNAEIDAIAGAMVALGSDVSSSGKKRRGRPVRSGKGAVGATSKGRGKTGSTRKAGPLTPRKGSLKDYIVRVLGTHSKPLSPHDLGAKVIKAGFKTKSKDLSKAISNALPKIKNIKRVGFGEYRLGGR